MADTNSISAQTGIRSYEEYKQTRVAKTTLGKNDFLSLLAAQLQYQNPLEPQTDTAFVAQLAQFSSLEYMQTMSETMTASQYYGLTGQCVYAEVTFEDGSKHEVGGIVDRVIMKDGIAYAQIGDYVIKCSAISQIINKDLVADNSSLLNQANLIGKHVKAYIPNPDDPTKTSIVSGQVMRVAIEDKFLVAFLEDGTRVGIGDIFDISDSAFVITEPDDGGDDEDAALVGKYIKANIPDPEDSTQTITVSGPVARIAVEDDKTFAYLDDGTKIELKDIDDVSEKPFTSETTPETTPEDGETP